MHTQASGTLHELDPRQEEKALVARMLAGDEPAMERFADGYFPGLYRFAIGRLAGDSDLAREIVQTTACKALARLESYRGEAPLFTWLCSCCLNEIRMHFRQKGRLPRIVAFEEREPEASFSPHLEPGEHPEGALARKEEAHLVHATLDRLPAHYARALEWKYLDRLPVQEIAGRLRLGAKAAESLLTRARRAFREGYERLSTEGGRGTVWPEKELEP